MPQPNDLVPKGLFAAFKLLFGVIGGTLLFRRFTTIDSQRPQLECINLPCKVNDTDAAKNEARTNWLEQWKNEAKSIANVTLRSASLVNGAPQVDMKNINAPTLIKCNDGSIWAAVNVNDNNGAPKLVPLPENLASKDLYKNLPFPSVNEKRPRRLVKTIFNREIIDDLSNAKGGANGGLGHIHVSEGYVSKDTGMDNRVAMLKQGDDYYVCGQGNNGEYRSRKIEHNDPLLNGRNITTLNYGSSENKNIFEKVISKVKGLFNKQDPKLVQACINLARVSDAGHPADTAFDMRSYDNRPVDEGGRAQRRTWSDAELASNRGDNMERIITSGAGLGLAFLPMFKSLGQSAISNLMYKGMGKIDQKAAEKAAARAAAPAGP